MDPERTARASEVQSTESKCGGSERLVIVGHGRASSDPDAHGDRSDAAGRAAASRGPDGIRGNVEVHSRNEDLIAALRLHAELGCSGQGDGIRLSERRYELGSVGRANISDDRIGENTKCKIQNKSIGRGGIEPVDVLSGGC